jgi:acylpyruvate hydrolase
MRLATITTPTGRRAVVSSDGAAQILGVEDVGEVMRLLASGTDLGQIPREGEADLAGLEFAPPVLRPEKILCVGLNYRAHAAEAQMEVTDTPVLFPKYSRALIGAHDDILLPPESSKVDWEAELALVIGRQVRRVSGDEARAAIGGYTVLNDVSMRDWQKHTSQMLPGKTFESSTPVGPWVVSPEELDDARDLRLQCRLNGEVMQDASTSDMIFDPVEVVTYISSIITLVPGDVIALGTPSGIGGRRVPPIFMKDGDRLVTECEGIGVLDNVCVTDVGVRSAQYV